MSSPWGRGAFNEGDDLRVAVRPVALEGTGRAKETGTGSGEIPGRLEDKTLWLRFEGWEDRGMGD